MSQNDSYFRCSNCGQPHKLIPIKNVPDPEQSVTFESTTPTGWRIKTRGWISSALAQSDGFNYALAGILAGAVVAAIANRWLTFQDAMTAGLLIGGMVGVGLHVSKIHVWRPHPPPPKPDTPSTIKLEVWDKSGADNIEHARFDNLNLSYDDLAKIAKAHKSGANLSRGELAVNTGLPKYRCRNILSELKRKDLAYTDKSNKTHLTISGRVLFRKLA